MLVVFFYFREIIFFVFKTCDSLRSDITVQYQPTFQLLKTVADSRLQKADKEYSILTSEIKSTKFRFGAAVQTQINYLKEIITNATKTPNTSAMVLACVKKYEASVAKLSTTSLNNCNSDGNLTALSASKTRFTTLSRVAANTVSWCDQLNPLETQDYTYEQCLNRKIPDLNRQLNLVETEYGQLSNATLNANVKCLTDLTGDTLKVLSEIKYEVNMCPYTADL